MISSSIHFPTNDIFFLQLNNAFVLMIGKSEAILKPLFDDLVDCAEKNRF
jgi:hypothetical protein